MLKSARTLEFTRGQMLVTTLVTIQLMFINRQLMRLVTSHSSGSALGKHLLWSAFLVIWVETKQNHFDSAKNLINLLFLRCSHLKGKKVKCSSPMKYVVMLTLKKKKDGQLFLEWFISTGGQIRKWYQM